MNVRDSMSKDPYFDQLMDYALGDLPQEAMMQVRLHLESGCASCQAEIRQIEGALNMLPLSLQAAAPSSSVKRRLFESIEAEAAWLSGRQNISHYRILRRLGVGAMGEVYLAEDTKLGRSTALKIIRPEVAGEAERKKRFLREARAAAGLAHPGIATIYEIGQDEGTDFIAMEYVEGRSLSSVIGGRPLNPDRVLRIGKQIAEALTEAHQRGILHRDLKPENIHIKGDDQVKILDFGLAKFLESRMDDDYLTTSERILGTIPYMSPEQVEGGALDPRSDLFSVGSILYEMASGKQPFTGKNPAETLENILRKNPPLLSSFNPGLPPDLQKVIYKCLQKDPGRRYETASLLAEDLQKVRTAETVDLENPFSEMTAPAAIRIAVMYFENLSEEKESDYFRAGMTEDIITELSKVRSWEVRSRSQVVPYKDQPFDVRETGRELKVTHMLQGSIRKAGARLRISAQLVDAKTATSVWGERYDRQLKDVFEIQSEIAEKIASALQVHLTKKEKNEIQKRHTDNLQAYDYYLRGREMIFRLTREDAQAAVEYFTKAIHADDRYALAYAGLAQAYGIQLSFFGGSAELADHAIANANKALEIDPSLAQAYVALGLAELLKGHGQTAIEACNKAIDLNPYDAFAAWIAGRLYYRLNQYEEAAQRFKRTIELLPDFYTAYSDLAQAYENMGMSQAAIEMKRETIQACRRSIANFPREARAYNFLATASAWLGERKQAMEAAERARELSPEDPVLLYNLACLYSILEEIDTALSYLRESIRLGRRDFEWMNRDPSLANLRKHPAYNTLQTE